ncbi:MAG: hypothetical protein DMF88_07700 [Acidobacteria bacterium]|nr:MAG: hypothetical protein DMF88_07700 [Acidobacteriota bacterium]
MTDATGSAILRIDADTNIDGTATPSGTFTVIGLASQFDSAPFDGGYQVLPRSLADIIGAGAPALSASPSSIDFGTVTVGGSAIATVTMTNVSALPLTLTPPFTITGTAASQYSAGVPAATTLAAGAATTVQVAFAPTTSGAKNATLNITSNSGSAVIALTGAGAPPGGGSSAGIVISDFRMRGPNAGNDEFIELYNPGAAPVAIGGYKVSGSNNAGTVSVRATITAGKIIPPHGHYLLRWRIRPTPPASPTTAVSR